MQLQVSSRISILVRVQRLLYGGSTVFFGGFMLANVVSYGYQMLVSRMLSPAEYGVIITLTSIFDVLAVLLRAAQSWVVEAVATPEGHSPRHPGAVFGIAMRTLAPIGGIIFAASWLGSAWIAGFLHLGTPTPVILLGAFVFSSFITSIALGLAMGLDRLGLASLAIVSESTVRLMVGLALVGLGLGASGAMAGFAIGNFAGFLIALVILWPVLAIRRSSAPPVGKTAGLDRVAPLALVTNIGLMAIVSVDQLVVKHFFSEEVAGNYAMAFLLGRIIAMSTIALGWVIFTRSATMASDSPRRRWVFIKGLLATGLVAVTMSSGYLTIPGELVQLLGGSQYNTANAYVRLMGIEMTLFAFTYVQVFYHLAIKNASVVWPLLIASLLEIALFMQFHATIAQIQTILIAVLGGLLLWVSSLSWRHFHSFDQPN